MIRTTSVTPFLLMGLLAVGCNEDDEVKTLPPEYRVLAKTLAQETKTSPKAFRDNKGPTEIIAEGHSAVLDLRGIKSTDTDIIYIAAQGDSAFTEAVRRMERLNALPKPPSMGSVMVESFVHGLYGNVLTGYAIGVEADKKQAAINAEFLGLVAAVEKADVAHLLLPRVAEKYSAPAAVNNGRIVADVDEIWGGSLSHDWLCLHNGGPEIEDCTILVEIKGKEGDFRKNVHFVPKWSSNTWIYSRYDIGKPVLNRVVGRMTVIGIDTVDISVYSPKFSTNFNYKYTGAEANKDIQKWCDTTKFSKNYRPFKAGVFWDDQRALHLRYDGGCGFLPKGNVVLTFKNGNQSKAWNWDFDSWFVNDWKLFETPKDGLTFDPETIDILITFPNTTAQINRTIKVE